MITTPEIICDLFSFLDKDQIERIQLVSQFWNNVIIRHKNILPLRLFKKLYFSDRIELYATKENIRTRLASCIINFDGTNLSKTEENVSSRYSQLTIDEVLKNLNDVVFYTIQIYCYCYSEVIMGDLLNMIKLVTTKIGGRLCGKFGEFDEAIFDLKLNEIFNNYCIVDVLTVSYLGEDYGSNSYLRKVFANPEIVQLPSTPKEIRLVELVFKEGDEVLHFTCNGKLNGANRVTIEFVFDTDQSYDTDYRNFIRQWFELYRTHQNPISLVRKFEHSPNKYCVDSALDAVKTFLSNTQLRVKYSLEIEEFHHPRFTQYVKRSCVLHETDSYALVIEVEYKVETDMSSINASDLDQPPCDKMKWITFCVKSL